MNGPGRRFDPSELRDADGAPLDDAEAAAALGVARELETFASTDTVAPTSGFEDRVMAAIAAEAPPRPVATGGFLAGLVVAFRDAWRIAWSGDRPMAVRAQAFALVLLVVVAFGSAGTLAAVGVSRLLDDRSAAPTEAPSTAPSFDQASPDRPATDAPSISPAPSASPESSESPEPSASVEPSETPHGTDDGAGAGSPDPTRTPRPTAKPTQTAEPSETPEPTETAEPTETEHPEDTPHPSKTPQPSKTPDPTDDSGH